MHFISHDFLMNRQFERSIYLKQSLHRLFTVTLDQYIFFKAKHSTTTIREHCFEHILAQKCILDHFYPKKATDCSFKCYVYYGMYI